LHRRLVWLCPGADLELATAKDGSPSRKQASEGSYIFEKALAADDLPASSNDASLVTRLTFRGVSFLFTGDIEAEGEGLLIRSGRLQPTTILKAAHHGSKTSSSQEFLDLVDPLFVVISVGAGNPFGHPSQEVLQRLADRRVWRTDQSGTIEIASDGTRLWGRSCRQSKKND
jgi:competence protein ComEC